MPGYIVGKEGGRKTGDNTLAQIICTMKSPRKQNSYAAGTVRTGTPIVADPAVEDALPRFPKQNQSEHTMPREIPLPEEESFRAFLNSRLPKHKASQALKDRIRSAVENSDI